MQRVARSYWKFLKSRAKDAGHLGARLIEMQWQFCPRLLPPLAALLFSISGVAPEAEVGVIVAATLVGLAGIVFVGSAFAAVHIDEGAENRRSEGED